MQSIYPEQLSVDRAEEIAREYEQFAYIVSHDMNAPLRHIRQFTRLLIDEADGELNENEKMYTDFLEQSLNKIADMQDALLTFSRLTTQAEKFKDVDCNDIVEDVRVHLSDVIDKQKVDIRVGKLPTITAEAKQIECLFYHLIENALKFHENDKVRKKVYVSATQQKNGWLFEVQDNGIGVPEHMLDAVFAMFKRLHPDEYDGIGAGLANAKKIIRRHSGHIYMESIEGEGTSVFFLIPKDLKAENNYSV